MTAFNNFLENIASNEFVAGLSGFPSFKKTNVSNLQFDQATVFPISKAVVPGLKIRDYNKLIYHYFLLYMMSSMFVFSDVNECLVNSPCKNGATCVNHVGEYQCLCAPGYTGQHCDQGTRLYQWKGIY